MGTNGSSHFRDHLHYDVAPSVPLSAIADSRDDLSKVSEVTISPSRTVGRPDTPRGCTEYLVGVNQPTSLSIGNNRQSITDANE